MGWDLEECVEDAVIAYMRAAPVSMRWFAAMEATDTDDVQLPCGIVGVESSRNPDDDGQFSGRRQMDVTVDIMLDVAPEVDEAGSVVKPFREVYRAAREAVIDYLARPNLHEHLNALAPRGVAFSMAHMTDSARAVEGRTAITAITLDVIAQPADR